MPRDASHVADRRSRRGRGGNNATRRSACEVCKTRNIPCEAEIPSCRNCADSGRTCRHNASCDPRARPFFEHLAKLRAGDDAGSEEISTSLDISRSPLPSPDPLHARLRTHDSNIQSYPTRRPTGCQADLSTTDRTRKRSLSPTMEFSRSDYEMIERNMAVTQNNTISNDSDLDDLDDLGAMDDDQDVPELTNAIKKHCIQLYFEGQGSLAVQVDETRFYERFSSYEPSQKPHRSLLNAMYLSICRSSSKEHVIQREKLFFKYAEAALQAALKDITTLAHYKLDLVRAATLLSVWLQGESREAEAIVMSGIACRLATASCLDQLPYTISDRSIDRLRLRLERRPVGGWPKDTLELVDSINTFWSLALHDLGAALVSGIPSQLHPHLIRTPLPRAEEDDEHGHTLSISNLFHNHPHAAGPTASDTARDHRPTPSHGSTPTPLQSQPSLPLGKLDLVSVIERFASQIPPRLRMMHRIVEGETTLSLSAVRLHFTLCAARMYVNDINYINERNDAAIHQARCMVDMMKLLRTEDLMKIGHPIQILWILAARLFACEIRRLRSSNQVMAVIALEADLTYIIDTLTKRCMRSALIHAEVRRILDAWKT